MNPGDSLLHQKYRQPVEDGIQEGVILPDQRMLQGAFDEAAGPVSDMALADALVDLLEQLGLGGPKPFFFDGPWHAWRREKASRASAAA